MTKIKKIIHYIFCEPRKFLLAILYRIAPIIPDRLYLKWLFRLTMRRKLNLDNPQTFSEKLQWLKLYNRKPEYTQMVDKYGAKQYVSERIGEEYIIPTLGVWDSFDEIEFEKLPNQFVLKTTHGGGNTGVVICKDKNTFDKSSARKCLNASLKSSIYTRLREWPYKNVKPRIIAEQYISDDENNDLPDYKFFCFNGEPKLCQVIRNRNTYETIDFYDDNWTHMPFVGLNSFAPNGINSVLKPYLIEEMLDISKKISEGIPFVRIDLYFVKNKVFFGEITFFPASGIGSFRPEEWNKILGSWIRL